MTGFPDGRKLLSVKIFDFSVSREQFLILISFFLQNEVRRSPDSLQHFLDDPGLQLANVTDSVVQNPAGAGFVKVCFVYSFV